MRQRIRIWLWVSIFSISGQVAYAMLPQYDGRYLPQNHAAIAYTGAVKKLTDIMVNDIVGPCGAARFYTYANLAAYEFMYQVQQPPLYISLAGLLNEYPAPEPTDPNGQIDVELGCVYTLLGVGEAMLPSGHLLEKVRSRLISDALSQRQLSAGQIKATQDYADRIVRQIVSYAASDGYSKTSGYPRYTPDLRPGFWTPTPPAYSEAYESHWASLRPFILDSAAQFRPALPVVYSEKSGSPFYVLAKEVYHTGRQLTPQQRHIADFWDCNPFFLNQKGHISFGTKKISPSGHWMGITGLIGSQQNISLSETIRWHTLVALTMSDAFSSCWQEKYASNRVRPETYINQFLDPNWRPILQTPPFPEYTSGHSVVSNAVAIVLTQLAGEVAYVDTIEEEFGVPARTYQSVRHAAREAALSRLYGGIHFRDSIEQGMSQGEAIGLFVLQKLGVSRPDDLINK